MTEYDQYPEPTTRMLWTRQDWYETFLARIINFPDAEVQRMQWQRIAGDVFVVCFSLVLFGTFYLGSPQLSTFPRHLQWILMASSLAPALVYLGLRLIGIVIERKDTALQEIHQNVGIGIFVVMNMLFMGAHFFATPRGHWLLAAILLFFGFSLLTSPERYDNERLWSKWKYERTQVYGFIARGHIVAGLTIAAWGLVDANGLVKVAGQWLILIAGPTIGLTAGVRKRLRRRRAKGA